jgi:hypothetical protein
MLTITRTKYGVPIRDVFFAPTAFTPSGDVSVWFLIQAATQGKTLAPFKTQIINLRQDVGVIFSKLSSNTRYKIKRAEREGLIPSLALTPSKDALESFANFFDEFAKQKKLPPCNRKKLIALHHKNAVFLSSTREASGELLTSHAYVKDNDSRRVRLLYSASHFRGVAESSQRNLIGRANRLLHWYEIQRLKEAHFTHYDLGGLPLNNTDEEKNAIARFKLEFGGDQVVEYSGYVAGTLLGRLALSLSPMKR